MHSIYDVSGGFLQNSRRPVSLNRNVLDVVDKSDLILAIMAALFGIGGIATGASEIAKIPSEKNLS